jgi:hypothetical protein
MPLKEPAFWSFVGLFIFIGMPFLTAASKLTWSLENWKQCTFLLVVGVLVGAFFFSILIKWGLVHRSTRKIRKILQLELE